MTRRHSDSLDPELQPANTALRVEITRKDLPLHCPMDGMALWNSHPRVYITIEKTGSALCPYCSTYYVLKDE